MATQTASGIDSETRPQLKPTGSVADPATKTTYHFLDVGGQKYGDCAVVEHGDVRILIDGSHVHDDRGQPGFRSIPEQLDGLLGGSRPYRFDLIVVTHCHADHVGCLPELVSKQVIRADFALLTDPKLGFGREPSQDAPAADSLSTADLLEALLREEDASDLDDRELQDFIDAVATVEQRYASFIADLEARQTQLIFYRGRPLDGALAERLRPMGAQLLGPSLDQLLLCAEQISSTNKEAQDMVADRSIDSVADVMSLYRSVALAEQADGGGSRRGNGMNCQSITFAFGPPGQRALLAGDMQFTDPGVRDANDEIVELRRKVAAAGPYKLFKTTHHTAHNGQDEALLAELGHPSLLVHSGGLRDESHPNEETLEMIGDQPDVWFARTDRNGLISVSPHFDGSDAITISRGTLNDFTPNRQPDSPAEFEIPTHAGPAQSAAPARGSPQVIIVNLPPGPVDMSVGGVDIVVRDPHHSGGGHALGFAGPGTTGRQPAPGADPNRQRLAGLLFVTDPDRLRHNIGRAEADSIIAGIGRAGGELVEGLGNALATAPARRLSREPAVRGVVLLGGYDVVPPQRLDAIGAGLRQRLSADEINSDSDRFVIWSDAAYGDRDGDGIADLPVSRIPDAREAALVAKALSSHPPRPRQRFGIRNVARPFADSVFQHVAGTAVLEVSEPLLSQQISPSHIAGDCHYLMLHGMHHDARTFVGEYLAGGPEPVAFEIGLVPRSFGGIVFSGCCWGALIVDRRASDSGQPAPRLPEDSIALAYLSAGASAFIGCTGAHYSGSSTDPDQNFAARLHQAFWIALNRDGKPPAQALFEARTLYMQETLRRRFTPLDTARRLKNFAQFTCLGLGW